VLAALWRLFVPIDRDAIYQQLLILVKTSAEPGPLAERKPLLGLECVKLHPARPAGDDSDRAFATSLKAVLRECSLSLSGWKKYAAQDLFGLGPGSGAKNLMQRDELAGRHKISDARPQGISGRRFANAWRDEIIKDLADKIWEREQEAIAHASGKMIEATTGSSIDVHGYRCISTECIYTISADDPHFHIQDRISVIEIMRPGVTEFEAWYQWTGRGRESDPVAISHDGDHLHAILKPIRKHHNWKYYYVDLGGEAEVGSRPRIHVRQNFYDEREEFETIYSLSIYSVQHWESGILRVRLPSNLMPREENIDFVTYASHDDRATPETSERGRIAGPANEIVWVLPQPLRVGYCYEIQWRYDDEKGLYRH
jgi:hypothetical protein